MRSTLVFLLATLPLAAAPGNLENGRKEFGSKCGFCHGPDASGSRAPDLIRSALTAHDEDGNLLGPVIRQGRPDKDMPAFPSLSATQLADIVAFIHAQQIAALRTNSVPGDYPIEKLLTGDAKAGQSYFNGAGGCAGCHSPEGDLKGIAKKFTPLNLQSRFLYPGGAAMTATVTTADGKQVRGKVARVDDFEIAVRDADGWYHSWPRSRVKVEIVDPLKAHRELLDQYSDKDVHNLFAYLETLQ